MLEGSFVQYDVTALEGEGSCDDSIWALFLNQKLCDVITDDPLTKTTESTKRTCDPQMLVVFVIFCFN